jgi:hypothetical protein
MALMAAYFDWLIHLSVSPGKQLQLWHKGVRKGAHLAAHVARWVAQGGCGNRHAFHHCRRTSDSAVTNFVFTNPEELQGW